MIKCDFIRFKNLLMCSGRKTFCAMTIYAEDSLCRFPVRTQETWKRLKALVIMWVVLVVQHTKVYSICFHFPRD